jgi:hypothetical protein
MVSSQGNTWHAQRKGIVISMMILLAIGALVVATTRGGMGKSAGRIFSRRY